MMQSTLYRTLRNVKTLGYLTNPIPLSEEQYCHALCLRERRQGFLQLQGEAHFVPRIRRLVALFQ